jgi:hypothetical protein
MLNSVEQQPRIGHFGKRAVEVVGVRQALPESAAPESLLVSSGRHAEQVLESLVEVGKDAIGIEE